jgi:cation-transporting ATPase 13A1
MCGDGTNDVGSLKRAHVGLALLNKEETQSEQRRNEMRYQMAMTDQLVPDGDASIAAPFTYRYDTIKCVINVLKQGRCTLAATIQMYKILALNCLMLAYSLSVLYYQGMKNGDFQSMMFAIPIMVYFFSISRATPLDRLEPFTPPHTIFALSQIGSVAIQFAVHLSGLMFLSQLSLQYTPPEDLIVHNETFRPSILNTVVVIYLSFVDATNFFINYEGEPFMESLWRSTFLSKFLVLHMAFLAIASLDFWEDLRWLLELHEFPPEFPHYFLIGTMVLDFAICYTVQTTIHQRLYGKH